MADKRKIDIKIYPLVKIENVRKVYKEYTNGAENEWWMTEHMCLWPKKSYESDADVNNYNKYLKTLSDKYEKYPFRGAHWINNKGIFSSVERRNLVEYEFLKKGIQIANSYPNTKGMYPLGYNLWPSFGFGVLFATDYNVPNNTPLVIWADTNWYPLLPRRKNKQSEVLDIEKYYDMEVENIKTDYYNMCPDCGNLFGLDGDGGNGFCIECAWNH